MKIQFSQILQAGLLLSVLPLSLPAQQPKTASDETSSTPVTTLKVQVREVVLPVTVRDKKGVIVSNLRQEDFTLAQDGRAQTIKSFSHETDLPFKLGLLVDTSRSQANALESERAASGKFVDQMLSRSSDKAFLIHFDHEVELLQDFTSAKSKLHHELDGMSTSNRTTQESSDSTDPSESGSGGNSGGNHHRGGGGGTALYDAIYLASNDLMQKESGHKALVILSDGVDRGSKETLNDAVDAAEKANVSVYTVYFKGEEDHQGGNPGMGRRGGLGGGYPGGGYPGGGYPGGRRVPNGGSGESHADGKKIMEQIAGRTGGVFFEAKKKDSFDEVYAKIAEELHGQYLLTYTPDKSADKDAADGFHKIALKAKDDKYTVITREGYYSEAGD